MSAKRRKAAEPLAHARVQGLLVEVLLPVQGLERLRAIQSRLPRHSLVDVIVGCVRIGLSVAERDPSTLLEELEA